MEIDAISGSALPRIVHVPTDRDRYNETELEFGYKLGVRETQKRGADVDRPAQKAARKEQIFDVLAHEVRSRIVPFGFFQQSRCIEGSGDPYSFEVASWCSDNQRSEEPRGG